MRINPRVVIAYKNFAANKGVSHIGLGVSALHNAKSLNAAGVPCEVWPIVDANQLRMALRYDEFMGRPQAITHCVISAPWIPTQSLAELCQIFPQIQFVVNSHSNVGFLQADANGVKLIREALGLELTTSNFRFAGNSDKFCRWIRDAYGNPCQYLPNLYHAGHMDKSHRPGFDGGTLKIGIFGAVRPQKNVASAAAAAVQIAQSMKVDTEIWVSGGRHEGGGEVVMRAVSEMVQGIPGVALKIAPWQTWPEFRRFVGSMHLLLQPSYTESFNMVTADGIAEGVPSVVSDAIDWAPRSWKAHFDEIDSIASVGENLLNDPCAPVRGKMALHKYVKQGLKAWLHYLAATMPL
jgi:hypothetical protein